MVPVWAHGAAQRPGLPLGRPEHVAARGRAVVGARRRRHEAVGRSRPGALGRSGSAPRFEPAPHHRLPADGAGAAKYPYAVDRALAADRRRRVGHQRAPSATPRAAAAPARSSRRPRSAPTATAWTCGPSRRPRPTTRSARAVSWKFSNFRSTNGYVAMPLDGLWLTGPFLHNGSVPSLADLLEPVEARPKQLLPRLRRLRLRPASAS